MQDLVCDGRPEPFVVLYQQFNTGHLCVIGLLRLGGTDTFADAFDYKL